MRRAFAETVMRICKEEDWFFLTGDLGFMALEEVRATLGDRFVNAGVAEQNMIGVAAGLARSGYKVLAYSIAPFVYGRPFEQIRNDVAMPNLPVCIVGNGGGFGYGHMGPTHHALEDCAAMNALGLKVLAPVFDDDLEPMIAALSGPTYMRLGLEVRSGISSIPSYAPWREILTGGCGAVAALGPLAGVAHQALAALPEMDRPAVWAVAHFNLETVPEPFWKKIDGSPLYIFEEHVAEGGLGSHLALAGLRRGVRPSQLIHRYALRYPTGRYGSQAFHRQQSGLDGEAMRMLVSRGAHDV